MARARRHRPDVPHRSAAEPPARATRLRFAVVAGVYLLWIGFLVLLVVTTANPVVVSRLYAARCQAVVRLEILPPTPDLPAGQPVRRCRVLGVYKGQVRARQILVTRIPADQRQPGRAGVAFLNPVPGTPLYELQPIRHKRYDPLKDRYEPGPPRLYPDTPGVVSQFESVFGPPSPPPVRTQPTTRPATQPQRTKPSASLPPINEQTPQRMAPLGGLLCIVRSGKVALGCPYHWVMM